MLKEYAVDPSIIASSFETCRFLVSQFGADKGRLIARFPKTWKRMAYDAANTLPDGLKKERVVEYLKELGEDWLTLISSNRPYTNPGDTWLVNAQVAHAVVPFSAILCDQDNPANQLIDATSCDENTPLFMAQTIQSVNRQANDLAAVAGLILQNCRALRLVDPYFDPTRPKWRNPLAALLALVPDIRRVECEYHLLEQDNSPSTAEFIQRLAQLRGVIPAHGTLRIIRWRETDGGERFHRRYLLTENAGLGYEGGLDEATGAQQTTDVSLLVPTHHAERWAEYNRDAQTYEMVKPVLVVDSAGRVTEEQ
jgi:hypothetical protein